MDTVSLRDFIDSKLDAINSKADRIIELQKETNGRVRKAEVAIALLQWAYGLGGLVVGWIVMDLIKP